ncbi:M81 family metallopeptidase [Acidomonas methanolica]|uniref:M81 family metallopeptidase n=5 Tax=Acidomonas methanolica TaxID=437 RepID=UPI00104901B8|nr:M81 family metallopeptidase [Acidomonas methanolica]MBU2655621.1 M81 family metallopeptidase [Acidomonas methanolica]TCS24426.1 microcystin degradation protein MlrC [Acidomonas methanolica]GEK99903.1 microcystinase C [Acidomonas methanolica NBRC 104435]
MTEPSSAHPPRIAFGGIHTECSTYNPVPIHLEDFRVLRGPAMLDAPYFAFLGAFDASFLPLVHARAVPGGRVERAAYEAFKTEFLSKLRAALPLDGLYLAMHGAMSVEGLDDAEADWIVAAREVVGPDCLIAASYDLHGNVSQPIVDALDIFSAYRTAPHIDVERTMRRAVEMLTEALRTGVRPRIVWAPVPLLLPGERTSTEDEPARSLYAVLPDYDSRPGVWDAALMVGYVWADEPRATASAVVTGTDEAALTDTAAAIARSWWAARHDFAFGVETGSVEACVARALACETRPVILADSGDNPTGGGVGDRADMLAALVARDAREAAVVAITDAPACASAFEAGAGARRIFAIGASLDPSGARVELDCEVLRLVDHADPSEREAVLRHGGVTIVLAARRRPYHTLADFHRVGLDPTALRILAVKSGYLSPDLAPLANPPLMALSEGSVNQDVAHLRRDRTQRPCFPFDADFDWTPRPRGQSRPRAAS